MRHHFWHTYCGSLHEVGGVVDTVLIIVGAALGLFGLGIMVIYLLKLEGCID